MDTIGVIGTGNMGGAILKGWNSLKDISLIGYDVDEQKLNKICRELKVEKAKDIPELIQKSSYILLAVKPTQVKGLLKKYEDLFLDFHILMSICAGIKIKKIKKWCGGRAKVVRIMPNTPALVGKGMFAICFQEEVDESIHGKVIELFNVLGKCFEIEEDYIDAYTALIGSGPAYIIYFLEALVEAGVSLGFQRQISIEMVKGLLSGTTKMIEELDISLAGLREMVTSPAGTTIAALNHFDRMAVRGAIIDALHQACKRSKELGE